MFRFSTLTRLGRYYHAHHLGYRFFAIPLGEGDETAGYIEECEYRHGFLTLRGWSLAHGLSLDVDGIRHSVPRRIQRGDVMVAMGSKMLASNNQHGRVGFDVTVPWAGGEPTLIADHLPDDATWALPMPDDRMIAAEHRRIKLAFWRDVARSVPTALRYALRGRKPADRIRLKRLLGLMNAPATSLSLNPDFLGAPDGQAAQTPAVTIVMPVYDAFELLTESVDRVERHTDIPWHLVLVEDASPDPRVRPWLIEWAAQRADRVTLLLNPANLGFIGSVNKGLKVAATRGGPVILLNSDAFVPAGWVSRLLRPIEADSNVASVTPMSNDATILSMPWIASKVVLEPGIADRIDAAARDLSPLAQARIPTGVGFCMAMSRAALDAVPLLDTAFGRGYGEEVDWCRKTARAGMVHLGIGNLFVQHVGGESFGSAQKIAATEDAAGILRARYPEFDEDVGRFIAADPLLTARLCLALARAAATSPDPLHIYIGHSLGGGAEHWLSARISERSGHHLQTAVIRVGGSRRFRIELHSTEGILTADSDDIALVRNLFNRLPKRHVVYSCGVGDDQPWELPELLSDLAEGDGSSLEILFHDYFPISPSLNLLDADGSYNGIPKLTSTDPAHQISRNGVHVSYASWRQRWSEAIGHASQLTVFSTNSAQIVEAAWPTAGPRIVCQPHRMLTVIPTLQAAIEGPGTIGILGAIGEVKGAQIVSQLAYHLEQLPSPPKLTVVGEFDHSFPLPASVRVTGRYDPANLGRTIATHGITVWLMPSIWPETFSFTTHEMLATGLPVMAFDLGAQGEAVRKAANGFVVPPEPAAIIDFYHNLRNRT